MRVFTNRNAQMWTMYEYGYVSVVENVSAVFVIARKKCRLVFGKLSFGTVPIQYSISPGLWQFFLSMNARHRTYLTASFFFFGLQYTQQ